MAGGAAGGLADKYGPQSRPTSPAQRTSPTAGAAEQVELDLAARLRAAGHELLGDLVQYHRREARPGWWDYFRLTDLEDDELIEDGSALGGLSAPVDIGTDKRSRLYRYTFPAQDTRLRIGEKAIDVDTRLAVGEVFGLDALAGVVVLKTTTPPAGSRGLGPEGPIRDAALRQAIRDTGDDVLAGRSTLGAALIDRRLPTGTALRSAESSAQAVLRVGSSLNGEVLAIQGPPGSGKTTAAADLVRALLDAGKRVGVTANSHAVIGHLLRSVRRPALQRCKEAQRCGAPGVRWLDDTPAVAAELAAGTAQLVGGTAWFWAHPDAAGTVDVLVVDEAGQFPLANAVAVARAAQSLVLLGDPQQLASPSRAVHPGGSGVSALTHLLEEHATIPADRGIFLDRTHRMHPALTAFVSDLAYDGRLQSAEGLERIEVLGGGAVAGSGLAVAEVAHRQVAAASSAQEADAVADLWRSFQGVGWIDRSGTRAVLGPDDVLVVAPYNNQVGLIRDRLPWARVGTVDKFQGQEAPVVIYSMTSTSADDAPRGVSFLYDLHRLNVAVSRAMALAVVVMSPELLDAPARTTAQLRQINALCRLTEMATIVRL